MTTLSTLLSTHSLFQSLDAEDITLLVNSSLERQFQKGAAITYAGDIWPYFFIVTDGAIEALKMSPEGRNLLVGIFNSDDVFWGLAFFREGEPMPVTLQASVASKVNIWSTEILQPIIVRNGRFAWELSRGLVDNMIRASSIVNGLAFQTVAGRVAQFLLENYPSDQQNLPRNLTLAEMASRTGTTREMVCRFLQKFADSGAIDITRTEFSITDRQKLENIANKS
jgi:CRP-like cAMP-binding protein